MGCAQSEHHRLIATRAIVGIFTGKTAFSTLLDYLLLQKCDVLFPLCRLFTLESSSYTYNDNNIKRSTPMTANIFSLNGLTRRLLRDNLITEAQAHSASESGQSVAAYLIDKGIVESKTIAMAASEEFGTPLFDLKAIDINTLPKDALKVDIIQKHNILPLYKRGNRLFVALTDPTKQKALDEATFASGLSCDAVLADHSSLQEAIAAFIDILDKADSGGLGDFDDDLDNLELEGGDPSKAEGGEEEGDETPIVRFVNKMLLDAIKGGASDIHFEPYEKSYRVRFRTDGVLFEKANPPVQLGSRIAARLKVMSQMDISERRKPQDGRVKMKISKNKAIDFRVNTLPCLFGEKVVLRILDPTSAQMGIESLGYEDNQRKMFEDTLVMPQGMILVTGPTGSGKTVSLYTGLNLLNQPERNISTAEDPVEINLEGINQCHVNPKVGLSFADALRSFLRQDPDVIMVGEIRDLETAEIAIKAAQTGHMVLSTLHTNSAAETITRLLNMGVPSFNLATSLNLIIAQRLARRLCKHCATPLEIPHEALLEQGFREDEFEEMELKQPVGCNKCNDGYKGRVGIYEVVRMTPELSEIIMEGGNSIELDKMMRKQGFNDLRRSALNKAKWGQTSLAEVARVTKD